MALYIRNIEKRLLAETRAYLYRWTHVPSNKWYVGSRTASDCHENDGYICSSRQVKPMIQQNPSEWKREILAIGEPKDMLELEAKFLTKIDAKNDPMSFNMHNGDGNFTTLGTKWSDEHRTNAIKSMSGIKKPEGFSEKIRQIRTGMKFYDEWRKNIGKASTGRPQDAEARRKNSLANSGDKNASFVGYYISPTGEVFDSSRKAGQKYNVVRQTIVRWATNNQNGWSFKPKGAK